MLLEKVAVALLYPIAGLHTGIGYGSGHRGSIANWIALATATHPELDEHPVGAPFLWQKVRKHEIILETKADMVARCARRKVLAIIARW